MAARSPLVGSQPTSARERGSTDESERISIKIADLSQDITSAGPYSEPHSPKSISIVSSPESSADHLVFSVGKDSVKISAGILSCLSPEQSTEAIDDAVRRLSSSTRPNNSPTVELSADPSPRDLETPKLVSPTDSPIFATAPKSLYSSFEIVEQSLMNYEVFGSIPSLSVSAQVEQLIQKKKVDAIISGDYDKADEFENLNSRFKSTMQNHSQTKTKSQKVQNLNDRMEEVRLELFEKSKDWEERIRRATEACKDEVRSLDADHEQKMQRFDEKWDDPKYLREFSKPSSRLLQLRKIEKSLILSRKYQKAKEVKLEADRLEDEETKIGQEKCAREMDIQREHLLDKQRSERQAMEARLGRSLSSLKRSRDDELGILERRIGKFERMIESAEAEPKAKSAAETPVIMTPRSEIKMMKYRNSSIFRPLKIQPSRAMSVQRKRRTANIRADELFQDTP